MLIEIVTFLNTRKLDINWKNNSPQSSLTVYGQVNNSAEANSNAVVGLAEIVAAVRQFRVLNNQCPIAVDVDAVAVRKKVEIPWFATYSGKKRNERRPWIVNKWLRNKVAKQYSKKE